MASLNNYLDELRGSQPLGHVDALDLKKVAVKENYLQYLRRKFSAKRSLSDNVCESLLWGLLHFIGIFYICE